jgi:hypothetical protein
MDNLKMIESMFKYLSSVTLTADTRDRREYQLAEYRRAYAHLLDTKPIWNDSFEIKNASLFANSHLNRLSSQFTETELIKEASRIIDAANLV